MNWSFDVEDKLVPVDELRFKSARILGLARPMDRRRFAGSSQINFSPRQIPVHEALVAQGCT
jgi:hypothetical protein